MSWHKSTEKSGDRAYPCPLVYMKSEIVEVEELTTSFPIRTSELVGSLMRLATQNRTRHFQCNTGGSEALLCIPEILSLGGGSRYFGMCEATKFVGNTTFQRRSMERS